MKKYLFVTLILFFFGSEVIAQSFTFIPQDTFKVASPNTEVIFDIPVVNLTNAALGICFVRRLNIMPESWSSSFCFDENCFASFLDSVATTPDFQSAPIEPGQNFHFSMHIFTDEPGTGVTKITAKSLKNLDDSVAVTLTTDVPTSLADNEFVNYPNTINLFQNYPNPFNPTTNISFYIDKESLITLQVFDMLGREVASPLSNYYSAGFHTFTYNANHLSSGVYLYKLTAYNINNSEVGLSPKVNKVTSLIKKMILEK